MTDPQSDSKGQPGLVPAALFGCCPRCGARTLFDGVAKFAPKCRACGLDFTQFNVGDGPAAFLTLIVGALVTIAALTVELKFSPPFWVHIVLWVPITAAAVIGSLRVAKAALLIAEYRRNAGEGQEKK
ncbi:DUF983 domain-containing protein [Novosphingobium lentum]|uniref:DUF983 domain-containing protein n=1 Tax=Novosphingobium lentum TaxID=145287 RepID=UPI00082E40D6|nr:DUF983 domain-containing protein [Novosphingobium lentum]